MIFAIKKLWPEIKPHYKQLILIVLLGFLVSLFKSAAPPLLTELQQAWERKDESLTWQIPIAMAGALVLMSIARYFHMFGMLFIAEKIAINMRRRLMDKYLSLNLSFFHSFVRGSGGLISRMLNDIGIIQTGFQKVADLVREPFAAVLSFGYLLYLDWRLTLFILLALPIITGVFRNLARSLRKYGRMNQESMEDLAKILKESLDGTRIVQSFNLQDEMRKRFDLRAGEFLRTKRKILSREEAAGPISESLAGFTISAILVYFGHQILDGKLTVAEFLGFMLAITILQDAIKKIQGGFILIQQAAVALERLHEILDSTSVLPEPAVPKSFPSQWDKIEFKNVSFSYGDRVILKNLNLEIKRGEVIALVGASGGGKSTLANLMGRFFDPSSGEILIGGVPIHQMQLKDLRAHIALVSQDVFLFGDSIEMNIHSGDFSKPIEGVQSAAQLANAHDFILKTPQSYESRVGELGSLLSGGEKQRISIARAIFKDAPILIMDEATSALDSESEKEVQMGLDSLVEGRTALVIAHRLSTIAKANRILVLKNGEVVEQGSHPELLNLKGEYFRFHQLQARM